MIVERIQLMTIHPSTPRFRSGAAISRWRGCLAIAFQLLFKVASRIGQRPLTTRQRQAKVAVSRVESEKWVKVELGITELTDELVVISIKVILGVSYCR